MDFGEDECIGEEMDLYIPRKEEKYFTTDFDINPCISVGTIVPTLNDIGEGTSNQNRIGRQVILESLHMRYYIKLNSNTASGFVPASDAVRVLIYLDKQANGAAAIPLDLLSIDNFLSFNEIDNSGRFVTLGEIIEDMNVLAITQNGVGNYSAADAYKTGEWHRNVRIPIDFSGPLGLLSNISSFNIGVLIISLRDTETRFRGKVRVRFTD